MPIPIYATPLTRGLIEVKLARNGVTGKADLHTIQAGETFRVGPFQVETFHVCHSIPDAVGLGITTPAGLVIHTGDYKFDQTPVDNWPTDFAKLAEFSARGVDVLLADSTNSERPGWTPSERVIGPALDEVFRNAPGQDHHCHVRFAYRPHAAGGRRSHTARPETGFRGHEHGG